MEINTPSYVASAFEKDCEILRIPSNFVKHLFTYQEKNECGSRGGFCKPIKTEDGKKEVVIGIREEKSRRKTLSNLRHNLKHAQQFLTGDCNNPVSDELAAYAYETRRNIEDAFSSVYRNFVRGINSLNF